MTVDKKKKVLRKNGRDNIGNTIFQEPEYSYDLLKHLLGNQIPFDMDDIELITLGNGILKAKVNDLGYLIKGKHMVFIEIQSTWTENISMRFLQYVAQAYRQYLLDHNSENKLYYSKTVQIPDVRLYLVYDNEDVSKIPKELLFSKVYFQGSPANLELKIQVLTKDNTEGSLNEYIRFCIVFKAAVNELGPTNEALLRIIETCKEENILTKYLETHKSEFLEDNMDDFDEELYIQARIEEAKEDARDEGRAEGRAEGRVEERGKSEARYAKLLDLLEKAKRSNDIFRAIRDEQFRRELYLEFGIA